MKQSVFSPRESLILKALGQRKRSITELVQAIEHSDHGYCDNNAVAGSVRRINLKCAYHRLDWFLNGMGGGRGGKIVWKDKA